VDVPLKVGRDGELLRLSIQSVDRNALMYRAGAH
jgi:hypothetical protein